MLDMVQRSRSASSQPVQEAIKTAGDAQQMRAAFDAALAYLQQQGGAGYAEKIAAQLAALLPLEG
jgi:glycosyltransferase A (GT-A) superfamily protein (DUF2064 family)